MAYYVPSTDPDSNIDQDPNYIVPVIASFSTKGGVQPLYFQYGDQVIRIHSVHFCEKMTHLVRYECTAALDGYLTEINLTYFPYDNKWIMKPR
ncbi:MAG: hypothetical protein K2K70_06015 [Lachnospiraceae bacterium]|nr:hypothetical protein [Lachnospiraceae bacterium]